MSGSAEPAATEQRIGKEMSQHGNSEVPAVATTTTPEENSELGAPDLAKTHRENAGQGADQTAETENTDPVAANFAKAVAEKGLADQTALAVETDGGIEPGTAFELSVHVKGRDQAVLHNPAFSAPGRMLHEPPQHMIRQIVDASITIRDEQTEIALSPEELGRVRLILSGREAAPHLTIWAERPEVLDQLRRNAAALLENFVDAGLENATFEFLDGGFDKQEDSRDWGASGNSAIEIEAPPHLAQQSLSGGGWAPLGSRIDIRM